MSQAMHGQLMVELLFLMKMTIQISSRPVLFINFMGMSLQRSLVSSKRQAFFVQLS